MNTAELEQAIRDKAWCVYVDVNAPTGTRNHLVQVSKYTDEYASQGLWRARGTGQLFRWAVHANELRLATAQELLSK